MMSTSLYIFTYLLNDKKYLVLFKLTKATICLSTADFIFFKLASSPRLTLVGIK